VYRRQRRVTYLFHGCQTDLRRLLAQWLENGTIASSKVAPLARVLAQAYAPIAARSLARKLRVPASIATITVGGATLGGSGKTRVAIACAALLAKQGAKVALVGHAYRAKPRGARVVTPACALGEVGDEAIACVRALGRAGARVVVVVAESRQHAVDYAIAHYPKLDALVIDGPLEIRPRRADLALLAVDAEHPWGSGALFPAGDLRASTSALLSRADQLVAVSARPAFVLCAKRTFPLSHLLGMRFGFFSAMARPARLLSALARANVTPSVVVHAPDHGPVSRRLADQIAHLDTRVEMWVASEKCALHLETLHLKRCELRKPIATFESTATLPDVVGARVQSLYQNRSS